MPQAAGYTTRINLSGGGVPKLPVDRAYVGRLGLVGDGHHDTKRHGGPDRAVCLLSVELIERSPRAPSPPATPFGEATELRPPPVLYPCPETPPRANITRVCSSGGTMPHHRQALSELMRRSTDEIGLAQAALLVAQERYPDLDHARYLKTLDDMAEAVRARLRPSAGPPRVLQALNGYLFDELGFCGNEDDYDNPCNSFLNDVLDRRTGIPITLSIVYIELAARLGLKLRGVGMPGHFLVKLARRDGEVVIDPYRGGVALSARELRARITEAGDSPDNAARHLAAATKRQVITRLLTNLKNIYLAKRSFDEALGAIEMILAVSPWDLDQIRDRGLVHYQRGAFPEALSDLETYVEYRATAGDAGEVRGHIQTLRPRVSGQE